MRYVIRERLEDAYELIETEDPTQALALALENRPDCILLDLTLPDLSGFELCQTFANFSATRMIPIVVLTARPAAEYRQFCIDLGAAEYFEKPINFQALKACLARLIEEKKEERRKHRRVQLRVLLGLRGTDAEGRKFEVETAAENVSTDGFLCTLSEPLSEGDEVQVFLRSTTDSVVGIARVVRCQWPGKPWQQYGFQFVQKSGPWVIEA